MDSVRTTVSIHFREGTGIKVEADAYPQDAECGWLTVKVGESDVTLHGLTDDQMMRLADRIYEAVSVKQGKSGVEECDRVRLPASSLP